MTTPRPYPLVFQPVYQNYLWGGDRIARTFHRLGTPPVCAESWEVSDRDDGMSRVARGACAGQTLRSLMQMWGADLTGAPRPDRFPLLVKLIDARETLSVQVHPNDETAARFGGEAKTEMWYVLDAAPGAQVYSGFLPGVTRLHVEAAIRAGTLKDLLVSVPVRAGDAVFMPGGRVHAIGAGCLMLEVQQNSNTTYRVYDWDRVGPDGRPRDLHIEEALRVIRWEDAEPVLAKPKSAEEPKPHARWHVLKSPYFAMEKLQVAGPRKLEERPDTFQMLFVSDGHLELIWPDGRETFEPGTTVLIPAAVRGASLFASSGATVLRVTRG